MRIRLPELDDLPARTTIWPRAGHTFTKRGGAWFCACEPFSAWKWGRVREWCDRYGIAAMDAPGQPDQIEQADDGPDDDGAEALTLAASGVAG